MKTTKILLLLTVFLSTIGFAEGNQKLAQTGMKFLIVSADARAAAMGDAFTAVEAGSSSLFYNPACMARMKPTSELSGCVTSWIADISYLHIGEALKLGDGDYGVIGISATNVSYGDLISTVVANNEDGYQDVGPFSPYAYSYGLGYAYAFSDRFSAGGNIKWVKQDLGPSYKSYDANGVLVPNDNARSVLAFDLGLLYRTGFKSLDFGVSVRNFSREVKYEKEGFQLPLLFKIGVSMNAFDLLDLDREVQSLLIGIDATHPRDYPEQLNLGVEYLFMQMIALRAGYMLNNDEYSWTAGIGLQKSFGDFNMGVDYSYLPFGVFDPVQRINFRLGL